jgi:hypothetical protein
MARSEKEKMLSGELIVPVIPRYSGTSLRHRIGLAATTPRCRHNESHFS